MLSKEEKEAAVEKLDDIVRDWSWSLERIVKATEEISERLAASNAARAEEWERINGRY